MNPNWPRWIASSLAVYFKAVADGLSLQFIADGIDDYEQSKLRVDHAELRVGGPYIYELSKDYFRIDVDTNVLITDLRAGEENPYSLMDWCGTFQQAALDTIPVYKFGTGAEDDDSLLGCLHFRTRRSPTSIFRSGEASPQERIRQASVDSRHWMFISN